MAEVIATALLKVVFDKLSSKVVEELGLLMGLDKQLGKLERSLSTIQDVLEDAEVRQVKEKALRGWLRQLKDVAYDADDVLDEIAAKASKWRPNIEPKKVRTLFSIPKSLVSSHKIAHRIKEIRDTLDEIAEERSKFHLREGSLLVNNNSESVEFGGFRETGSLVEESQVYGRQEEKEKIINYVLRMSDDAQHEGDPAVIAIVGLGGLGKTTVAQLIYNDERVSDHFEVKIWVCVSMDFDIKRIYRSIIESVTGREYNLKDMDSMQQTLRGHLGNKKFLLVLDDVWNENHDKWDRFRVALTTGSRGSKVVVTTRSQRVASVMGSTASCWLTGLSEDDCWALFERRAFGVGGAAKTPNLEAIGREIVKKCGGVPLAAKALGSLMHFKREESVWLAIKDSEIWTLSDDENEILPALKLSYDHLPSRLKQCFAYCSLFPKAFEISKETLVQMWIAEGFIRSSDGSGNVEDVGFQYVDELLSRSLFQKDTKFGGAEGEIKMHDLVHDLARSIAGDECSIVDDTGRGITQSSRYSSFICHSKISSIPESLCNAKKLRTFYLIASKGMTEDQDKAQEFLHVLFSSSRVLRALHLSSLPIKTLPNSLKKLKHLRYLNLSHTHLEMLPQYICTLQNLETLDLYSCQALVSLPDSIGNLLNLLSLNLSRCSSLLSLPNSIGRLHKLRKLDLSFCQIQTLPESLSCLSNLQMLKLNYCHFVLELPKNMKDMRNLVHLDLYGCYSLTSMPAGIGQLSRLRTLTRFLLGGESRCSITELGGLNLEGYLEIRGLENVTNAEEARNAKLKEKHSIRSLELSWGATFYGKLMQAIQDNHDAESFIEALMAQWDSHSKLSEDVLEALQPHTNLEILSIYFFEGRTLPCWMIELSFPNLTQITLSSCIRCTHIPAFGQLPCLEALTLSNLPGIKCLGSEFYGGSNAFPLLEELNLSCMPELEEWSSTTDKDILPSLAKLRLSDCPKLKALPSTFPSVKSLDMDVDHGFLLESGSFPNLKHLSIGNVGDGDLPAVISDRMSSLGSWSVRNKPEPFYDDSTSFTSSGFTFTTTYCGDTVEELLPHWRSMSLTYQ